MDGNKLFYAFTFNLPDQMLPSFDVSGAKVKWTVTAFGQRPGCFQSNRCWERPFTAVPSDKPGFLIGQHLLQHASQFDGPWLPFDTAGWVRRRFWHKPGKIIARFEFPRYPTIPKSTPIPFASPC